MAQFNLDNDDVVTMVIGQSLINVQTFTISQFKDLFQRNMPNSVLGTWLAEGVECKILRPSGGGWQQGKVRMTLEFIPDKISNPEPSDVVLSPNSEQ